VQFGTAQKNYLNKQKIPFELSKGIFFKLFNPIPKQATTLSSIEGSARKGDGLFFSRHSEHSKTQSKKFPYIRGVAAKPMGCAVLKHFVKV
jgi:hypothetical protein